MARYVAALPLSSYAADSGPVTVSAKIDETLEISDDSDGTVDLGTLGYGISTAETTITVKASTEGQKYNLVVKDADDDTGLHKDGSTADTTNVIPTNTVVAGKTGWGVRTSTESAFRAMVGYSDETGVTLVTGGTANTTGATTTVVFGATYNSSEKALATGTYTDQVVFIATATE